jgi:hypothetical protein
LTSALDGGEWSVSGSCHFNPRERAPGIQRFGEPHSRSGRGGEEKNSQTLPGLESPIIQLPNTVTVIKSRMMIWVGFVARVAELRNAYEVSVGKPEVKSPLGRPRRKWKDTIGTNLRKRVGCCDRDSSG